jgi:Gpi18-like mannosyltransferase
MSLATDLEQPPRPVASSQETLPRWRRVIGSWQVRHVLVPFVVTRVALALIGWLALQSFQNLPASPSAWEIKANGNVAAVSSNGRTAVLSVEVHPLVNIWARWDAGWYFQIAKDGYEFKRGRESNAAFFPVYPMLMRAVHAVLPGKTDLSWFVAGIMVSNAALLIALHYLALLVRLEFDERDAARAVLYMAVFPTSFFFSAVYAESCFLAATLAAFYYARRNRWLVAGACAAVAVLTRTPGILLLVPLGLEYLHQRGFRWRDIRLNAAALLVIPAALGGWMYYLHLRFGNAMAMRDAQASWGHGWGELTWPWQPFIRFLQHATVMNEIINVTFATVTLALIAVAVVKLRASYAVYAALAYWFVTAWGSFDSMPRYVLPIFPAIIALALLGRNQLFDRVYLIVASSFAAFFMVRFSLWRWVA